MIPIAVVCPAVEAPGTTARGKLLTLPKPTTGKGDDGC